VFSGQYGNSPELPSEILYGGLFCPQQASNFLRIPGHMTSPSKSENVERLADSCVFDAKSLKAVVFDAVGTVMYPQPSVADAYRKTLLRHCQTDVSAEKATEVVRQALRERSTDSDLRTNEDSESEFWASIIRSLCPGSPGFQDCFDDLFAHFADANHWRCFPDVAESVPNLQRAGLQLAVASNFDLRLNSVCDGLPPLAQIPQRLISSQIGWRKPAPEFFAAVCDELNLAPEQILMVGDDLQNDVAGAISAGMSAAWICRDPSVQADVPSAAIRLASLSELNTILGIDVTGDGTTVGRKAEQHRA